MNPNSPIIIPTTRRGFPQAASAAVAGGALLGALAPSRFAHAASGTDEIKIALIGCGGRGSGAADQALSTYSIGPVKLVAMADIHEDRLKSSLSNLQKQHGDRVDVPEGAPVPRLRRLQEGHRSSPTSSSSPRLPDSAR